MTNTASVSPELTVPLSRVSSFIRQITHDVRNNLNAMDLQAAFACELITDEEALQEVKRIRQLVQQATKQLQSLSANFQSGTPSPVEYSGRIFVEDLRDRLGKMFPEQFSEVTWETTVDDENISVDIEMVFNAFAEIFKNAFQFKEPDGKIEANAFPQGHQMVVEITETKTAIPSDPQEWGKEPFQSTRRGGYGLGLFRAKRLIEVQGGEIVAAYNSTGGLLTTRVSLPFAAR